MTERKCLTCGAPVDKCMAFTLGRDVLALMEGKKLTTIREFCGICDLNGNMWRWIKEHPHD